MSRILSELLGVSEFMLSDNIGRLEAASAKPSHDVHLSTEIMTKVRQKTRELGLDPKDSTGRELYHALLNLVKLHDEFLATKIGASDPADVDDLLPRIRRTVLRLNIHKTAWLLKTSVAKRLLKECPPKRVMKYLGYKSLDSMLKREPVGEIYAGMLLLETPEWLEKYIRQYISLRQMDFEVRPIDVLRLDKKKWGEAAGDYVKSRRHIITQVRELGVVLILPPPFTRRRGITITVLTQVLHHINEIRLYSAFYKLQQMRPDFGEIVADSLLNDRSIHVTLASHKVHWRVVQRHIARQGADRHPEILEPHVEPNDLSWRKAEESLYRLEPALHFWEDIDYVGIVKSSKPLSFNLMDTAVSYLNGLSYEERTYGHMRGSLWNELFIRYMAEPALEAQAYRQLDSETSTPALIALARR